MIRLDFSISYFDVLQQRNNFGAYVVNKSGHENVPLPSHFNITHFNISAIDNFDHTDAATLSGKRHNHDSSCNGIISNQ